MAALPAKTSFTGAAVTEVGFKTAFESLHDYLTGLFGSDGVPSTARGVLGAIHFVAGTRLLFQQTAAPTGWTKEAGATYNDAALRIVTGTVGTGGADAFSVHFGAGKTTAGHALTVAQLAAHGHTVTDSGHAHGAGSLTYGLGSSGNGGAQAPQPSDSPTSYSRAVEGSTASVGTGISIANSGSGEAHTHSLSNFNIKFADVIIASKD